MNQRHNLLICAHLMGFWLGNVERLLLLQLVVVGAVRQMVAVRHAAGAARKGEEGNW